MNKKELAVKYHGAVRMLCGVHNLRNVFRCKMKGQGNQIAAPCALLKKVSIVFQGNNNRVIVEDFSTLKNVSVYISGDNNTVHIGRWCHLIDTELCIEDSGGAITLGEHTWVLGKTHFAAIEGTEIRIGRDCLFSSDIHFRTGDSHSVLDMEGRRTNLSRSIVVGDHVWIGTKVICLKGAQIAPHCVVGAGTLVTGAFQQPHCSLAGVPAKVVKQGIDWSLERIPVGKIAPDFEPESYAMEGIMR